MVSGDKSNGVKIAGIIVGGICVVVFLALIFNNNSNSSSNNDNVTSTSTTGDSQEIQNLQSEVNQLKQNNEATKQVASSSPTISSIVSEWGPVIPIVVCNFRYSNGTINESLEGSGTLVHKSNGDFAVFTNQHVIYDGTNYANDCQFQFPNDPTIFTTQAANMSEDPNGADAAMLIISNPDSYLQSLIINNTKRFCTISPNVGDELVILGYPAIGASSGLTATDGIISGFDGNYYVTSAKVDHGNSGGAAIDVQSDCYLGIPTYVVSGQLESLARILKWQATVPSGDVQNAINDAL
jgi:hypothetical protein